MKQFKSLQHRKMIASIFQDGGWVHLQLVTVKFITNPFIARNKHFLSESHPEFSMLCPSQHERTRAQMFFKPYVVQIFWMGTFSSFLLKHGLCFIMVVKNTSLEGAEAKESICLKVSGGLFLMTNLKNHKFFKHKFSHLHAQTMRTGLMTLLAPGFKYPLQHHCCSVGRKQRVWDCPTASSWCLQR